MQAGVGIHDQLLIRSYPVGEQGGGRIDVSLDRGQRDWAEFVMTRGGANDADDHAVERYLRAVRRQVVE